MASDLSLLIENSLTQTIEANLSKTTSLSKTFVVDNNALKDINLVVANSQFTYSNLTSTIRFIIPAYTASLITNIMMMEDKEPSLEVDEEILDANSEIISQISGSLETAINGSGFEDLGSTKFEIKDKSIVSGNDYTLLGKLFLLKLSIEDKEVDIFLDISEETLPYIEALNNSETLNQDEEDEEDEKIDIAELGIEGLEIEEPEEETQEEAPKEEEIQEEPKEEKPAEIKEDENAPDEEEQEEENKKQKKLKLLIMIIGGIIVSVLIGFGVAYYMGVFDPPPVVVDVNKTKKKTLIIADIPNKQIDFKIDMINVKRLNKQLKILTKYEILDKDAIEKFKQQEKVRLYKLKMKQLEEFSLNNKEERLFKKNLPNEKNTDTNKIEQNSYLMISALKYKQYKDIIQYEKPPQTKISICKNSKNEIKVYVGPIHLKIVINNIFNKINETTSLDKNDIKLVFFTDKQFDKECGF